MAVILALAPMLPSVCISRPAPFDPPLAITLTNSAIAWLFWPAAYASIATPVPPVATAVTLRYQLALVTPPTPLAQMAVAPDPDATTMLFRIVLLLTVTAVHCDPSDFLRTTWSTFAPFATSAEYE